MSHNIDMSNDRANIAFLGSRKDVWHHLGQEMLPGQSIPEWAAAAGLEWEAIKVPAYADLNGDKFNHIEIVNDLDAKLIRVPNKSFIVRSDNGEPLGYVSNRYKAVQPAEVLDWFQRYISVDDRFQLDVAGSLSGGRVIWATATFRDSMTIAGEHHVARLLMSTSYDGTYATINQGSMTRTVCNNTLDISLMDKSAMVRTRHCSTFDPDAVSEELARITQSFENYKAIGEAMTQIHLSEHQIKEFFNKILHVPEDPVAEISTRKENQVTALYNAYATTLSEGARSSSAWAVLQAVTRYVDHDRIANDNKRRLSAQFGEGAALKRRAFTLLQAA